MSLEPLTFDLIEGGKLRLDFEDAFEALQSSLIAHCQKWEGKAKGATASLTLSIKLKVRTPDDWFIEVTGDLKAVPPPLRPPVSTSGVGGHRRQGQPILFCRPEGSDREDPRQTTIFSVPAEEVKE